MVIPKQLFNKLGGFNENMSRLGDREFCEKIRNAGVKMVLNKIALIFKAAFSTKKGPDYRPFSIQFYLGGMLSS